MADQRSEPPLVLFDGVCGMCNHFVVACLRRDRRGVLRFASNASPLGRNVLEKFGASEDAQRTIVVLVEDRLLRRSDAMLCIARQLGFPYSLIGVLHFIPRAIRDRAYDFVAHHRYRFFKTVEECQLIPPELQSRIISE